MLVLYRIVWFESIFDWIGLSASVWLSLHVAGFGLVLCWYRIVLCGLKESIFEWIGLDCQL